MQDVLKQPVSENGVQTKITEPTIKPYIGVLSDVSDLIEPTEGNAYFILTFTLPNGETKTLPINASFWHKISRRYPLDSFVRFSTEKRVEGKTEYVNKKTGAVEKHTKSGEYFKTLNRIPESLYTIEVKKILGEDLELRITGQEEASKQMALATFYSNFYRS